MLCRYISRLWNLSQLHLINNNNKKTKQKQTKTFQKVHMQTPLETNFSRKQWHQMSILKLLQSAKKIPALHCFPRQLKGTHKTCSVWDNTLKSTVVKACSLKTDKVHKCISESTQVAAKQFLRQWRKNKVKRKRDTDTASWQMRRRGGRERRRREKLLC